MTAKGSDDSDTGPWNPGIKSTLPLEYLPLSTIFRPENVFTSIETATELSDFTGLTVQQLICFRPIRDKNISRNTDQQLMNNESLGAKTNKLLNGEPSKIT